MLFNRKHPRAYRCPDTSLYRFYYDLLQGNEEHILLAGAPGSGKSVLLNGLLTTMLKDSPAVTQLILIDPKQVELRQYSDLPHVVAYGNSKDSIIMALQAAVKVMETRLATMARTGERKYSGPRLYVLIDELLDLMTDPAIKGVVQPLLLKLAALGRAPAVFLIACTQCPLATVLPTPFKACFVRRIALRTASKQDSRNILGLPGAETLPIPRVAGRGYCLLMDGITARQEEVPMYTAEQTQALLNWWMSPRCIAVA